MLGAFIYYLLSRAHVRERSQVCKTPIVMVNRNKYLTLNRCPLGNDEYKKQNKSDQTAFLLFTKFGKGNLKGVAKQCFD